MQHELDLTNPPPLQLEQRQKFEAGFTPAPPSNELHLSLTHPYWAQTQSISVKQGAATNPF